MSDDGAKILSGAIHAVAIWCRSHHVSLSDADRDDMIAHVCECVVQARARGYQSGRRAYQLYAVDAYRKLRGDRRYQSFWLRPLPVAALPDVPQHRDELHGLRLWRLQRIWPTLTPLQRATVAGYAIGYTPTEIAEQVGSTMGAVSATLATATRRLDEPQAFTRVGSRQAFRRTTSGRYVEVQL